MLENGLTRSQKYYFKNKEKVLARQHEYRSNNREYINNLEQKRYYKNSQKKLLKQRERYNSNTEYVLAQGRKSYHKNKNKPERKRNYRNGQLKRRYGISIDVYEKMVLEQNGVCKICEKPPKRCLGVDHNHSTGQVRDLLCEVCNQALGMFKESPELLEKAADYVRRWIR